MPEHLYRGDCPDDTQPDRRDADCPACQETRRRDDILAWAERAAAVLDRVVDHDLECDTGCATRRESRHMPDLCTCGAVATVREAEALHGEARALGLRGARAEGCTCDARGDDPHRFSCSLTGAYSYRGPAALRESGEEAAGA